MSLTRCLTALALGLATLMPLSAAAAEAWPAASRFDIAFGGGVVSDYLVRGISQTHNQPAVQAFAEIDYQQLYAGVWTSNVNPSGTPSQEVDLAFGWRPTVDRFAFDFGYVHYGYLDGAAASPFDEVYAGVHYLVPDTAALLGAKVNFAPDYASSGTSATYAEATVGITLPNDFGISGALGYQWFDASYGASYLTGNIGAYWSLNKSTRLEVRYSTTALSSGACAGLMSFGDVCGGKLLVSLSVATSAETLTGKPLTE